MTVHIPSRHEIGIHPLSEGLSIEWREEGRIFCFVWHNISRDTVDTYTEAFKKIVAEWPLAEPCLHLNDISFPNFSFTPYLRSKVQEAIQAGVDRGVRGRVANVMVAGLTTRVVQLFTRAAALGKNTQSQVFFDREKAYQWLKQDLKQDLKPK